MNFKLLYQFILIGIVVLLTTIFFKEYFSEDKIVQVNKSESEMPELNSIKDIKYISTDINGNIYEIIASDGIPSDDQKHLIELNNVKAKIIFEDTQEITITSDYAIYNQKNFDTKFKNEVKIMYGFHNIRCNFLNAEFSKNLATLEGNLTYNNLNSEMHADVMQIDLITKSKNIHVR